MSIEKIPYRWQRRTALTFGLLVAAAITPPLFVLCVVAEGVPHAFEDMRSLWRGIMDDARRCWFLPNVQADS
jgi:hypothetical protein